MSKSMARSEPIGDKPEPAVTLLGGDQPSAAPVRSEPAQPMVKMTKPPEPAALPPEDGEKKAERAEPPPAPQPRRGSKLWLLAVPIVVAALGAGGFLFLRPTKVRIAITIAGDIGAGQVISEPMGIDCGDICTGRFKKGEPLTLVAKPAPHYQFAGWSGDCTGTATCKLQPRWEQQVEARFVREPPSAPPVVAPKPSRQPVKRGATGSRRP
jgi:hypothetical protein